MKKICCGIAIVCGSIGLYMSIIGLITIPDQTLLCLFAIFFCFIGMLVLIFEMIGKEEGKYFITILRFLGILVLLSTSAFVLFTSHFVFIKLISVFGLLLFGFGLIKVFKKNKVAREKKIALSLDYTSAFEKSVEALKEINAEIKESNKVEGFIIARTGMSWKSIGEELIVRLKSLNNRQTQIKIISKPIALLTVLDYGKNLENVNKFTKFIQA